MSVILVSLAILFYFIKTFNENLLFFKALLRLIKMNSHQDMCLESDMVKDDSIIRSNKTTEIYLLLRTTQVS